MPEMTAAEAAEKLKWLGDHLLAEDCMNIPDCCNAVKQAASILRRVASGELAELSCKKIVPDGVRDCAGSHDEWFRDDFCKNCQKYGGALMDEPQGGEKTL